VDRVLATACEAVLRVSLVFLRTPAPPPSFTLFPYTTLFRSSQDRQVLLANGQRLELTEWSALAGSFLDLLDRFELQGLMFERGVDRKSTRLNSSHLGTSYAVFCLKKKKRHRTTSHPNG